jgi:proton-translocating NADH-quinone oxidoreductase chain L
MPIPALLLVLATLLPLASFLLLMFVGKRLGSPLAGYIGTAFIGASFLCSLLCLFYWVAGGGPVDHEWGYGQRPICMSIPWIPVGAADRPGGIGQEHPGYLDLGVYIDSLTVALFNMISLTATLVHLFSLGYMRHDPRFPRFFTYLGLFCFSMLGLVLGATLLHLFIFWELVGLCSYLLIGFWYEKRTASNAAIKAFLVNRVGDVGFIIGLGILFYEIGNVSLPQLWMILGDAGRGGSIALPGGAVFPAALLTLAGIGLFCGAMGKSAQFPLHVWLPDAMEGPTPVSALIHAATMVAAGVYLLGRIFPVLTPDAKLFIAVIGCVTLTMAALIAVVQSDIKRVLAFSTISQLGYMVMAIGVGSWTGGLFHLITHAFFKALLFLGAGSVIQAADHEQELPHYGGLIYKIPATAIALLIGVLAISGVGLWDVGFSGYYSKDLILAHAGAFAWAATAAGRSPAYWLFFILPTAVAYITPFYMTRFWALTFLGKPRDQALYDGARERPAMWAPLAVLAGLSIISGGGFFGVRAMLEGSRQETQRYCDELLKQSARDTAAEMPPAQTALAPTVDLAGAAGISGVPAAAPIAGVVSNPGVISNPVVWNPAGALIPGDAPGSGAVAVADLGPVAGPAAIAGSWVGKRFHGFEQAWPSEQPERDASADVSRGDAEDTVVAPADRAAPALDRGQSLVRVYAAWAFIVGIGAALVVYRDGYGIADRLMAFVPLAVLHRWLYRRMYFDELYALLFVAPVSEILCPLAGWFDRNIVDGIVKLSAWAVWSLAKMAGWNDRKIIDGAVDGAAALAQDLGAAVRAPQTGRIRTYVAALMVLVAAGLAVAVIADFVAISGK